jgi:hypothetical protein
MLRPGLVVHSLYASRHELRTCRSTSLTRQLGPFPAHGVAPYAKETVEVADGYRFDGRGTGLVERVKVLVLLYDLAG